MRFQEKRESYGLGRGNNTVYMRKEGNYFGRYHDAVTVFQPRAHAIHVTYLRWVLRKRTCHAGLAGILLLIRGVLMRVGQQMWNGSQ